MVVNVSAGFHQSLAQGTPPGGLSPSLTGLWWAKKGDWDKAHRIVMKDESAEAAWVHAYLHRVEGDLPNARYWYRTAGKPEFKGTLEAEWEAMVAALLA
jgi:hypothetical protein